MGERQSKRGRVPERDRFFCSVILQMNDLIKDHKIIVQQFVLFTEVQGGERGVKKYRPSKVREKKSKIESRIPGVTNKFVNPLSNL